MKILSVVGPSGSGKTRLVRSLIAEFKKRGLSVAAVKHCREDHPIDREGKDSWSYAEAGADQAGVITPCRTAVFDANVRGGDWRKTIEKYFHGADIVLVEGGKDLRGLKKLNIVRGEGYEKVSVPADEILAVVSDSPGIEGKPVFPPDAVREIAGFILSEESVSSILPTGVEGTGNNHRNFERDFFSKHDPDVLAILRRSAVGIAGAGGLGSNAALSLARAGVGRLIIADFDKVEAANLNRQQFTVSQIGMFKVRALAENIRRSAPFTACVLHEIGITTANAAEVFKEADILVEAFDKAGAKEMLIEAWIRAFPDRPIVAASGLAGFGANRKIRTRRMGNLYICGDEESECAEGISPMAPRVALVANMQANLVVELLVRKGKRHV